VRIALIGDAESPHLLKWARALGAAPDVELWVASSRGFLSGFDTVVPSPRRLALGTRPAHRGGNIGALASLPRLGAWLRKVDADFLHAHYLTSHGTLAWLAKRLFRLRARIVGTAWGSDVLVTPAQSGANRWLISRVLRACVLTTSDSLHMAERMRAFGAVDVMTFPFGLEALPATVGVKSEWLFFANRGLEPVYRPERVIEAFASIAGTRPDARLVVANDGSLRMRMEALAGAMGLSVGTLAAGQQIEFVGRLDPPAQQRWYEMARWYFSLPQSDSVSVSVLEAMAHGCIPLLSDLPANREIVEDRRNGLIVASGATVDLHALDALSAKADAIAGENRAWIAEHALFAPAMAPFLAKLRRLASA
jgi:glycosyltransferase involved in cell wall biosynthesis